MNESHTSSSAGKEVTKPTAPASFDRRFFVRIGLQVGGFFLAGVLLLVLLGVAQRTGWLGDDKSSSVGATGASADAVYSCPMHPQIRQPRPGSCPICGMALELATADSGSSHDELAVTIEPAARRLANIQTAVAQEEAITKTFEAVGRVALDESRQATISAYVGGRIERLFADYTGVDVAQGDHLVVLYSPTLYAAQVEYLESHRSLQQMNSNALPVVYQTQQRLAENSRAKLIEYGMTEAQIAELDRTDQAQSRLTIHSPIGGTVLEKLAVEGAYVEVGQPIYRVADLSTVWLILQLYPEDASHVRFGQLVEAEVQSLPDQTVTGRVAFVNPTVDEATRTVDVRVEVSNAEGLLRPGDYARARLHVPLGREGRIFDADLAGKWISPMHPQIVRDEPGKCPVCGMALVPTSQYGFTDEPVEQPKLLTIPRDAVLTAGGDSIVYVETEPGRFELRPITLGQIVDSRAVVLEGLKAGDEVATSGNFLIDSQMQLSGKPSLIDLERVRNRPKNPEGPLSLKNLTATALPGELGVEIERLYQAYFAVQAELAADRVPAEKLATELTGIAHQLAQRDDLPEDARPLLEAMAKNAAHLHHLELKPAREHFKPVSHAVLKLAAQYRGEAAESPFIHYWCSMVPGGDGDWLQASSPPANPYWGSEMLRCVQHEQQLMPANAEAEAEAAAEGQHKHEHAEGA